jgi:O-glycosyl hydrolase
MPELQVSNLLDRMNDKKFLYPLLFLMFLIACNNGNSGVKDYPRKKDQGVLILTANTNKTHQTIYGFGASDAWSIQFVGKNWPLKKKKKIADLLFSTDFDSDGNPEGIGLSVWRFNIGAGSKRQGKESGIPNSWRRTGSFLTADSSYNWSEQKGQQWFMKAAKKRGVQRFIGFVNSPPVLLTKNGKAYGNGGGYANIAQDNYTYFADYLAKVAKHFKSIGIPLDYISPVNEPQWNWAKSNGQEGSPYQNGEIAGFVKVLGRKIKEYNLNTKIEIPEAGKITFLYDGNLQGRNNEINSFFGAYSKIKQLPSLAHLVSAHSYFTTWPVSKMIKTRQKLWQHIQSIDPDLKYWMTEYCILANNDKIHGSSRDLGIKSALYVDRVIHYDLTVANASSWQWWLAVSPNDFKDGLVYIDKSKQNGNIYESKMLWGMGNYSRFIRPGAVRLTINRSDSLTPYETANKLMASAYTQKDNQKLTFVIINYRYEDKKIKLNVDGIEPSKVSKLTPYVTSSKFNLEPQPAIKLGQTIKIPARSIVTFSGTYE